MHLGFVRCLRTDLIVPLTTFRDACVETALGLMLGLQVQVTKYLNSVGYKYIERICRIFATLAAKTRFETK